ncbi:hypothetical protein EW145_g4059 [Phellinidium pouzarii]|uniref:FAD-binding PCMH-type domain-containing protein n=1 Tax=Phellinidium pouzarii TaxID=167371 RepID=A0A4S4L6Q0_9AGAM|nr:hypothetical protein EW145_g4059 [Phellinidium pouzarii]
MRTSRVLSILASAELSVAFTAFASDWQALNVSVNGQLFQGTPFARPCFPDAVGTGGMFDQEQCTLVQNNYTTRDLRILEFGAPNGKLVKSDFKSVCSIRLSPTIHWRSIVEPATKEAFLMLMYATSKALARTSFLFNWFFQKIDVQSANDIIAAFNFSRKTGVPLVVKNTGHDYKGRSSGPATLGIWTHNFQNLSFSSTFVPEGCPSFSPQPAVTLGAGVKHIDLFNFAEANNLTLPGGTDPTVGAAGGYFQWTERYVSPYAHELLQVEVVVPSGEILIANECQNSDLFFALRGGGGGTFGVVLSVTEKAFPQTTFPTIQAAIQNTPENQRLFMAFMAENMVDYALQGWGGFLAPSLGCILTNPTMNLSAAEASLQNMKTFVEGHLNGTFVAVLEPSWLGFFTTFIEPTDVYSLQRALQPVGLPYAVASRLIPKANFATNESRTELIDTLFPIFDTVQQSLIFSVAPFMFAANGGNTSVTSINPIWYDSLWHVTASMFWNFNTTLVERIGNYTLLSKTMDTLRAITPGAGAYQNEADVYEPNHIESFWGSNYPKLFAIKQKYDPEGLLDCWHCVGSKGQLNPRFKCYIPENLIRG